MSQNERKFPKIKKKFQQVSRKETRKNFYEKIKAFIYPIYATVKERLTRKNLIVSGAIIVAVIVGILLVVLVGQNPEKRKEQQVEPPTESATAVINDDVLPKTDEDEPEKTPEPEPIRLEYGMDDVMIISLQERLMDLGYMDPSEPTEHFGSYTRSAVMLFQRQHALDQDGIVGEKTYQLLMSDDAEKYLLKQGIKGEDVAEIQERLYQMGYLGKKSDVTGYFGDVTLAAVKKFQETNNLSVDGKVGEETRELFFDENAKPNILAYGEKSETVLSYQKKLKELAYLTTEPDGTYGKDTLAAVKQFQVMNALVVDGFLGPATRELIDSGKAQANALAIGSDGDTVKNVQKLLVKANYLTEKSTTGYYGGVTDAAVRSFQSKNGLSVDGKVGKQTLNLLMSGDYVKAKTPITNSGGGGKSSNGGATISKLIKIARTKLGNHYVRGAKGPNTFDCSGFVYWCLNQVGIKQSYLTTYGWRSIGKYTKIKDINAVKAGDVVLFHINGMGSTRGHIGIATNTNDFIHAISGEDRVIESSFKQPYWKSRFICAYRIF